MKTEILEEDLDYFVEIGIQVDLGCEVETEVIDKDILVIKYEGYRLLYVARSEIAAQRMLVDGLALIKRGKVEDEQFKFRA